MHDSIFKFKITKLILVSVLLLALVISTIPLTNSPVYAATSLKIIQVKETPTTALKKTLYVGEKMDWDVLLNSTPYGGSAAQGFTWSSSNTSVVTIADPGIMTGKTKGSATITVKYKDGTKATASIQIKQPAASVTLAKTAAVNVGSATKLTATINPSTTNDSANGCAWKSSNTAVATVDNSGKVMGIKNGTATITATFTNAGRVSSSSPVPATVSASSTVTVSTPVSGVTLNQTSGSVIVGQTFALKATVLPATASNKAVTWATSDTSIAAVSNAGLVTGISAGTATITVQTANGGKTATCEVTVVAAAIPVTSVSLDKTKIDMTVGAKLTLKATILPATATNKTVAWKTSNNKIATISNAGVVTAKGAGKATITIVTADGNKKATCVVTVTIPAPTKAKTVKGTKITSKYYYTFINGDDWYFKGKQKHNYYLSNTDKNTLVNKIWNNKNYKIYYASRKEVLASVNSNIKTKWGGSCYGMSSTIALNRLGQINMRTYTKSKGKGRQLNQVKYPKNSARVKSAINYYQMSQCYIDGDYASYGNSKINYSDWQKELKSTVHVTKTNNKLQLFCFWRNDWAHAILVKKYVNIVKTNANGKTTKWYRFLTYDPNCPNSKTYIYISTDYKQCKVSKYGKAFAVETTSNFTEYKNIKI